jgi:hypothetical protein
MNPVTGGRLEAEADRQHDDADREQRARSQTVDAGGHRDGAQIRGAGSAEHERDAQQEERTRERAQQEIFQRTLSGSRIPPVQAREHVDWHRHQLESDENEHQIGRARKHHHAYRGEQHQHVQLTQPQVFLCQVATRDEQEHRDGDEEHVVREDAKPVERDGPARRGR